MKNVLLLLPLLLSHQIGQFDLWLDAGIGLVLFCLAASSVYLVNDVVDVDADRRHPAKKRRPLAAGRISPGTLLAVAAGLSAAVLFMAWARMPLGFVWMLAAYLILAHLYSLALKRIVLVDVFVLAVLYASRVLAGGQATAIKISPWLLALIIFLFVSLAFAKRCAEIRLTVDEGLPRRGYRSADLRLLEALGVVSGYLSVLVLALYINSPAALLLYPRPWLLWPVCLLLMYWISRTWLLVQREELRDDPLVFFSKDPVSYVLGVLTAVLGVAASL
ncbi:MAG TPA: UbiA family prenyltransferase [Acidobacteriota bacterium]|nr:UbiA family prenyltransferase [Acidobacteriota bacterium]